MEAISWVTQHFTIEGLGVIGSLLVTAYAAYRDEKARRIGNLIAIKQQYREIWQELYNQPALFRVIKTDVDLILKPVSDKESLFIKELFVHLDTVHRAMKWGLFVRLGGVQKDIRGFMSLPIPKAVWEKIKPFQEEDFVQFIDGALAQGKSSL